MADLASDAVMITLQCLEEPGLGRVLVVDGGASMRCALLGDNIAEMAYKNDWSVRFPQPLDSPELFQ